jgi:hypothetical protein
LAVGQAYIAAVKKVQVPYHNAVVLSYNNTATGIDGALVGTAKNTGSFDIHDLVIYTSAHDSKGAWIDSVKSNIIPILKPGEHIAFTAKPAHLSSQWYHISAALAWHFSNRLIP